MASAAVTPIFIFAKSSSMVLMSLLLTRHRQNARQGEATQLKSRPPSRSGRLFPSLIADQSVPIRIPDVTKTSNLQTRLGRREGVWRTVRMRGPLQCPELLRLICKQIGTDDKRALTRLCLTCKSFMGPALDEMWYKLDSLDPLVRCMDSDLYEQKMEWIKEHRVVTLVSNCFPPPPLI
jgi:hypothetical protein